MLNLIGRYLSQDVVSLQQFFGLDSVLLKFGPFVNCIAFHRQFVSAQILAINFCMLVICYLYLCISNNQSNIILAHY